MTRLKRDQLKKLGLQVPRNKYNARKVEIDGITFDSQKEAAKYAELKLLQQAGEVKEIELQPVFELQPGFRDKDGVYVRPITYRADFKVTWKDGRVQVIDVKGYRTKDYQIKKKLFLAKYPDVEFLEV